MNIPGTFKIVFFFFFFLREMIIFFFQLKHTQKIEQQTFEKATKRENPTDRNVESPKCVASLLDYWPIRTKVHIYIKILKKKQV